MFILVSVVRDVFMQIVGSRVRWYRQWVRGLSEIRKEVHADSGVRCVFIQPVASGVCLYIQGVCLCR